MHHKPGCKLAIEERAGFLSARVDGGNAGGDLIDECQRNIVHEILARHSRKVMIQRDSGQRVSVADLFRIPLLVDDLNAVGIKYAFVDAAGYSSGAYNMAMLHLRNRGFHVRLFQNAKDAGNWLMTGC
jgi:hypothetical protein